MGQGQGNTFCLRQGGMDEGIAGDRGAEQGACTSATLPQQIKGRQESALLFLLLCPSPQLEAVYWGKGLAWLGVIQYPHHGRGGTRGAQQWGYMAEILYFHRTEGACTSTTSILLQSGPLAQRMGIPTSKLLPSTNPLQKQPHRCARGPLLISRVFHNLIMSMTGSDSHTSSYSRGFSGPRLSHQTPPNAKKNQESYRDPYLKVSGNREPERQSQR